MRETTTEPRTVNGSVRDAAPAIVNGENHDGSNPRPKAHQGRRRKHKVIIHTSPFLRCIQTSIAISAGIAEYQDPLQAVGHAFGATVHPMHSAHPMHSGSPHIRAMEHSNAPHLDAIPEPDESLEETLPKSEARESQIVQSQLRVDAFLGEWLSPDYFESITPPPSSVMMVAGAKADLLRSGEHPSSTRESRKDSESRGDLAGGWRSGGTTSEGAPQKESSGGALTNMSNLKQSLPKLDRANSHSNDGGASRRPIERALSRFDTIPDLSHTRSYVPPTPSYAISPLDPIPPGYVAHAQEYCIDIDYAWDSMRPPLDWGNGGEYGEEWSAMHKRFRRGLHSMILWYGSRSINKKPRNINEDGVDDQSAEDDDDETDTVLVLVTHGAGCNALIGALTNQPVLLDVGMASLTMAVRKENRNKPSSSLKPSVRTSRRRSSIDLGISDDYEVKITASTEHLRAGTHAKSASISQRSSGTSSPQALAYRHRSGSTMSTASTNSSSDGNLNSELEGAANVINMSGGLQRSASTAIRSSSALWSKPIPQQKDGTAEQETETITSTFRNPASLKTNVPLKKPEHYVFDQDDATQTMSPITNHQPPAVGQQGLWGAPPPVPTTDRDKGPKRRWTHSEHR